MQPDGNWTILIVSADAATRASLVACFEADYRVRATVSGRDALSLQDTEEVDLVLADQHLGDMSGVEFLHGMRVSHPETIRVLTTGPMNHDELLRSINEAAVYQVVPTPWNADHLGLLVKRALESRELARRHRYLSRELKFADSVLRRQNDRMAKLLQDSYEFDKMVFASDSMAAVCNLARKAAATDLPVLIQGETGTGKELMARAVHFFSNRKTFPFLAQNCGALPDELLQSELFGHKRGTFTGAFSDRLGLFPAADGGTVFLDEISDVSPAFQVSLLRFLQEGEVKPLGTHVTRRCNVRIIAASNQNLKELVEQKKFRRDLYYRLRGFELNIPPLRERVEDIAVLADHAAHKYAESLHKKIAGISADVLKRLKVYSFPGNVRELENEVRRMVALAGDGEFLSAELMSPEFARLIPRESRPADPAYLSQQGSLKDKVEALETHLVAQSLLAHRWNHSRAARELGLSRVGLANKIKRYGLDRKATG
ncbi:MAG: sigma-54 dependent transcriptional regulator [Burkholderiaceae bacterium]